MSFIDNRRIVNYLSVACMALAFTACIPSFKQRTENKSVPAVYSSGSQDSTNTAKVQWKEFFTDPNLIVLIDSALKNNQELNIVMHDILIAQNEVKGRKGQYLPFLYLAGGAGVEKVGRYTRNGANDATTDIKPGTETPDPLQNYFLSANVSWQLDIWKQLRNSRKSAMMRYLSSVDGRNFMVTMLIAELANSYYELMALDNQLEILKSNIAILENALTVVKLQKEAGTVTELAVRKFEAEVYKNQSELYYIQQRIVETENHLNFLAGRYPQPVQRSSQAFNDLVPNTIYSGVPSQLLENRPDIRQAENALAAAKLDVKVAKANFFPMVNITAGIGYEAFNPDYLFTSPESMLYNLAGSLVAPLINRNAIKADYLSANSRQMQTVYNYERTVLNAYTEVANQLANIDNLEKSYDAKYKQVDALNRSINIAIFLFKTARADYMEVLMTQRDALEARMELVETKKNQMNAMVNVYQVLGGGW